MPVVSDYTTIVGDSNIQIGDNHNESGWTKQFSTGGRLSSQKAFISFMVKGMTQTENNAQVFVNDTNVGKLFNNNNGKRNHWNTQTISLAGSVLKSSGNNTLRVEPVINAENFGGDFDDYFIRNVICHFKQNA